MVLVIEEAIEREHAPHPCEWNGEHCTVCGVGWQHDAENPVEWLEDLDVPARFAVCETCDGKGRHVNPSIDAHGISAEEFADDSDFAEDYHRGVYDVPCAECGGNRVTPEPDWDQLDAATKARVEARIESHYQIEAEYAAERRMGA